MPTVGLIYDHLVRPETTGIYCLRALAELAHIEQFHPSQLADLRRDGYDFYLFVDDGLAYPLPDDLRPQAYWAIDTHIDFPRSCERAAEADFVFAAQKNGAELLAQRLGRQIEWLPLACDPTIHARQNVPPSLNLSFVGNLIGEERVRLVRLLQSEFLGVHVGQHYFEEMAAVYSASRLVFNRSVVDDINMRVFEGLCSGSLLVTNDLSDNGQEDLFQDAKHFVTYANDEELLDKVRFYLRNEATRERIAAAGRQEVCAKHTYAHRVKRILETVSRKTQIRVPGLPTAMRLGHDPHYYEFSRPEILAQIPEDANRILDVGCGAGQLGRALKERGDCIVFGVEVDEVAARRASNWLDRVWIGDIESIELSDLPRESLDAIVCGDVLEHLREPRAVLQRLARYLRSGGRLVASIPNVSHHTILRGLLAGNWTYEPAGLLDETHLRFFTAREIEKLFFRSGFRIDQMATVRGPGDESEALGNAEEAISLGGYTIGNLPPASIDSLTAYQYLVVATPAISPTSEKLTSIVMLTSNQLEYTKLCLASIRSRTDEPYEVIIVDNGSTDGTVEYLRSMDGVRLIANAENRGFPTAVNQGIRESHGDYIVLINNDCIVTTGWLTRLLSALHSSPDIGLVGPYSNCVSGLQQIPVDYDLLSDLDGFAWEWGKRHAGQRLETDRLVAFCLLVKRTVIDRIGLLDKRFGLGNFEDDDFCRRALGAGFKAVIAEDAFVHHFGSVTYRSMGQGFATLLDHNRRLFEEKWSSETEVSQPSRRPTSPSPVFELRRCDEPGLRLAVSRPRVSLCMIVRDSARTLGACLASIRPWVDEMIVVDTGSTDATPEIAREHGAQVFHFPWCDDFSAARNESLSHATGEWLFWMDSDDTINAENGRKLRELVDEGHQTTVMGYVAQVHCPHAQDSPDYTAVDHVKLFRNLPELCFEGRIHEQILPAINRLGGEVAWTDIFVVHSGSDHSLEAQAKKLARDLRLLELENAERPDHPFTLFNLGMTYLEMQRYEEASRFLQRTIAVAGPHESHVPKAFSLLIQAQSELGQMESALERCDEGLQRYPDDPELSFRAGVLAQHFGRLADAERHYQRVLAGNFERKFRSIDRGILGYKTRHNLAALYDAQGRHAEAESHWRLIVAERPQYDTAWRGLVSSLLKQDKVTHARDVIGNSEVLRQMPVLVGILLASVEEAVGNVEAARLILESAVGKSPDQFEPRDALCRLLFDHGQPDEASTALQELTEKFPDNPSALYNLGTIRFRQERYDAAIELYHKSLALRPDWPPAYANLATCYQRLGLRDEADKVLARARRYPGSDLRPPGPTRMVAP